MRDAPETQTAPTTLSKITQEYLTKDLLRLTTAGSVDDGKSTLIGRLLFDSKAIFQDQLDTLERTSELRGEKDVNLALLTDGLRAEREQGITIDVAYRYFATPKRKFIIADTPGHVQYTRNMVTGASTADLAIILIDARNGVLTQSKRHGFIASLLGIPHVVVAVNKMDLVDYSQEVFDSIVEEYTDFSSKLDIHDVTFIPISALAGDNVVNHSERMPWYDGPSVLHHLEHVTISADRNLVDFRFPVQYVIRPHQDFRGFAGTVVSGTIRKGEEVVALPSMRGSRVKEIHTHAGELDEAFESQAVVLTLEDEIDVSRGEMLVRTHNVPKVNNRLEAILCWMDESKELSTTTHYILQHGTRVVRAYVNELLYRIDVNTLHREEAQTLALNEIGRVAVTAAQPLFFDAYHDNRANGGFVIIDPATNRTVGAGMMRTDSRTLAEVTAEVKQTSHVPHVSPNVVWDLGEVDREAREERNAHKAMVVWFTGLSGSGKSTIAKALEKQLFEEGRQVVRLDGDNVRHGLCGDLGFAEEDRRENIRRVAEVAKLFFEAGHIVLCCFISPYETDRAFARSLVPEGRFVEVYVKCDLDECRRRDPKGLYARAAAGEIRGLTGVDAPYEEPVGAEVVVDTTVEDPAQAGTAVVRAFGWG
ncbi:MAG: sulfate adenylyltransferase subunit CysN [Spirochaetota bacterium]